MRRLLILLLLGTASYFGWIYWKGKPDFFSSLLGKDFSTFKVRFTAQSIMEKHKKELLKKGSAFLEPQVTYFPYLLMEVKYATNEKNTNEGMLLWGLSDGEMVVNVDNWEKTHGFEDCLMAKVKSDEFKILRLLAKSGGSIDKTKLATLLNQNFDEWIDGCKEKKLIVESGGKLRLHLQDPKLETEPQTELNEFIVTLPSFPSRKESKRYSISEVVKLTQIAFGEDFAIRREREVYLPVYEIAVQNEDGSIMRTYWNALTGKQVDEHLREI